MSETRLQIVLSRRPDDATEEEFDTWYDQHLREILAIPGFVSARRFRIEPVVGADGPLAAFTHIAVYEVEGGFDDLLRAMADMHLDTADAYVEYKHLDPTPPPLPPWWDAIRFASFNCSALGDTVRAS
jgi:hypothetical protein